MQSRRVGIWFYYLWAVVVFALDYASKKLIERSLDLYEQIPVIGDFFLITSIRNRGAAFGILEGKRVFFILITVVVVLAILWYLHRTYKSGSKLMLFALPTVLGGAVGNFLDRALFGEVVDFLQFNFGSYTFPIFNLADVAICVGVGLIILDSLLTARQEKKNEHEHGEQSEEQTV
ncbi:signal peptidase II [Cohnella thailandensis]|mgnify:CR=1 FL=1|jgi:lipoprotein signal peptidase|uniref:Lipoprotein signal peptidase n=1 Tax=Cohnella thailandensis TaxID=557557 RepID=A0A841T1S5_9BACL|nr:signal peptidase II [Cohnella thailandensis]MBB6636338.1 signal peptidase II [Cohnella thailandensis]MBP1973692.1 signal peptidase II [Cohnella thailandensis]